MFAASGKATWMQCRRKVGPLFFSSWSCPPPALSYKHPPRRILFGSCSSQHGPQECWTTMHAQQPDIVLLMGDNVYENESSSIHQAYDTLRDSSSFRTLYESVPILATLDDNDYTKGDYENGKQAFLDFFQIPAVDPRQQHGRGVYTCYEWTDALQLILLDVRYYQDATTILGTEQWEWLQDAYSRGSFPLRLIVSPIQIMATGHPWECWSTLCHGDRYKLLNMIHKHHHNNTAATILLSGDRHVGAFYETGKDCFREVTSSSLTHSVQPVGALDDNEAKEPTRTCNYVYENNFGQLDIDWENKSVHAMLKRTVEEDGEPIEERKWSF